MREALRRAGDPARLMASADLAEKVLGWRPSRDIEAIVGAWERQRKHPEGYGA